MELDPGTVLSLMELANNAETLYIGCARIHTLQEGQIHDGTDTGTKTAN